MASRPKGILAVALVIGMLCNSSAAFAKSPKPTLAQIQAAKKAEIAKRAAASMAAAQLARASQGLKALTSAALKAQGRYREALLKLSLAMDAAKAAEFHAQRTSEEVMAVHQIIGKLATNAYIMGGGLTDIEPLLSSNGPQDLIDRLSTLSAIGAHNSTALARYKAAQVIADGAKRAAVAARIAQQSATIEVASAKKAADAARAAQQAEVDKLQKVQDELMRELANAKRVRITLEQQRQLALLEEARSNRAEKSSGIKKVWSGQGFKGRFVIRATQSQRLAAVAFAKAQVLAGKPYVWGAQGPNAYDCSGLVYAAYKAAGLVWPQWNRLNAALYAGNTNQVPLSEKLPGDLLFYSSDGTIGNIYHVSIYAGDGMTWDARSTRSGLRYGSIFDLQGLMPFVGRV